jgi:hypothetical protein
MWSRRSAGTFFVQTAVQQLGQFGVLLAPGPIDGFPFLVVGDQALLVLGKVGLDLVGYVKGFLRQAESPAGGIGEFRPAFPMPFGGSGHLRDSPGDFGFGFDELRLARGGMLRFLKRRQKGSHVVTIHPLHVESIGLVALAGILALGFAGHGVECDVVGIVDNDQVIELEVARESGSLRRHALLQAAVSGQDHDMVIENRVFIGIKAPLRHFAGHGHAHAVADSLAEWACGGFHSRGFTILRVPRGYAVELAEIPDLLQGKVVPGKMQPAVKEHTAVTGGEDKTVPVDPTGLFRVVAQGMPVKDRSNFRCPKGQPEVTGAAGVDRVDG